MLKSAEIGHQARKSTKLMLTELPIDATVGGIGIEWSPGVRAE